MCCTEFFTDASKCESTVSFSFSKLSLYETLPTIRVAKFLPHDVARAAGSILFEQCQCALITQWQHLKAMDNQIVVIPHIDKIVQPCCFYSGLKSKLRSVHGDAPI